MALYFNPNPEAQRAIMKTIFFVYNNHSLSSFTAFMGKLSYLDGYGDDGVDVILTSANRRPVQDKEDFIEFGIQWTQQKDINEPHYEHPIYCRENIFMVGGLVYHGNDQWGCSYLKVAEK